MKKNQLSGEIEARLEAVRGRIRRVQLVRAATVVATVSLGGLFVLIAVDYFLSPLPAALRWGMTGAWLLAVLAAARFGTVPLLKPIGLLQVARWLEGRHPEMEERLSTVLELSGDPSGVSHELLESLARAAEIDAGKVDVSLEVNAARTTRRWARPAAALAVLMLLALVIWPGETSRLLVRAVAPFSAAGNAGAGRFTVKPGDLEVLEGDAVRIETKYDGRAKVLQLVMHLEGGREIQQELSRQGGIHVYTLEPAKQSFHYQARAGRVAGDRRQTGGGGQGGCLGEWRQGGIFMDSGRQGIRRGGGDAEASVRQGGRSAAFSRRGPGRPRPGGGFAPSLAERSEGAP